MRERSGLHSPSVDLGPRPPRKGAGAAPGQGLARALPELSVSSGGAGWEGPWRDVWLGGFPLQALKPGRAETMGKVAKPWGGVCMSLAQRGGLAELTAGQRGRPGLHPGAGQSLPWARAGSCSQRRAVPTSRPATAQLTCTMRCPCTPARPAPGEHWAPRGTLLGRPWLL